MPLGDTRAYCTSQVIGYLLSVSHPHVLGMFDGGILLYKVTLKSDSENSSLLLFLLLYICFKIFILFIFFISSLELVCFFSSANDRNSEGQHLLTAYCMPDAFIRFSMY